jgi:hypothetical protein
VGKQTGNRGGKRTPSEGKKLGRPAKPKIEIRADKGVASKVLEMDGKPDHQRACNCRVCTGDDKKKCECKTLASDTPGTTLKIECQYCRIRDEHQICRCEMCGWWALLEATDRRLVFETRRYLTDRRDGKPAQGVFVGDTRESTRELDFGDLPELITPGQSRSAGKPN